MTAPARRSGLLPAIQINSDTQVRRLWSRRGAGVSAGQSISVSARALTRASTRQLTLPATLVKAHDDNLYVNVNFTLE